MISRIENAIDALFALPLDEFTAARNTLAARLKKEGRPGDAERVKSLQKPPVSAWAVNQLYRQHREAFDRLLEAAREFRKAQARESLEARRDSLRELSQLAADILQTAGHNAGPDTLRRVGTTLEALSTYLSAPGSSYPMYPGRLTEDVDPPGFDVLAGLGTHLPQAKESKKTEVPISEAKATLRNAEQALKRAQAVAEKTDAARKKAAEVRKQAEEWMREADERLKSATAEADEAAKAVDHAERAVKDASRRLQLLLRGG